jgi:hypothetical protein
MNVLMAAIRFMAVALLRLWVEVWCALAVLIGWVPRSA